VSAGAHAALAAALADAGGTGAPPAHTAGLRTLLDAALRHGAAELTKPRSGYGDPVVVTFGLYDGGLSQPGGRADAGDGGPAPVLIAATPAGAGLRADPEEAREREWALVAATVGALVELAEPGLPAAAADLALVAGPVAGAFLALGVPAGRLAAGDLDELAPLAFDEHAGRIDRLRAAALALPGAVLADAAGGLRTPLGAGHPLLVAEAVARMGGRPEDPESAASLDDALEALLAPPGSAAARPHEDPDPGRRAARRILQRLSGMGKWGGYHTDFAHLPRGFAGNERALAQEVGEALLRAGLLAEKPSVGQRHVYLNPRRAAEIHRLIEDGAVPPGLQLP
jgi:hypothetical protein